MLVIESRPAPPDGRDRSEHEPDELGVGWHRDPFDRFPHRWWDGDAWTASVAVGGAVQWDPAPIDGVEPLSPGLPGILAAFLGYGVGVGLSVLVGLGLAHADRPVSRATELAMVSSALWLGLLGAVASVSVRRGSRSLVRDFGLRFRWSDLGFGAAGAVVARIVAGVAIAPLPVLDRDLGEGTDRSVFDGATADSRSWLVLVAVVCVGAPLVEELFFRGLLQNRLVGRYGLATGIGVASVLFGAAHLIAWDGPITIVHAWAVGAGGVVLGATYHYSKRLGPAIVAHALFNAVALVALWQLR